MAKTTLVIKTDSKNGAENIKASRDATNLQNLEQDRKVWERLSNLKDSDIVEGKVKILKGYAKNGNPKYKADADANKIVDKMKKQIYRMNSIHFGINSESEIELWMIKDKINAILSSDDNLIQCDYCRNSTRQSIDELVQIETLKKYVIDAKVFKPTNGSLTLKDSKIFQKPKNEKANKDPRSIDIVVEKKGIKYYLFAKYAGPVGSVTSKLQTSEAISFLEEAKLYVENNPNSSYFVVLIDGYAGELHIQDLKELVQEYPQIFVGNSEQVIDWLNTFA